MNQLRQELAELDRHIDELERIRTAIVNRIDALERASRRHGHKPDAVSQQRGQLLAFRAHTTPQPHYEDEQMSVRVDERNDSNFMTD